VFNIGSWADGWWGGFFVVGEFGLDEVAEDGNLRIVNRES